MDVFLDYLTFPLLLVLEKDYIFRRKKYTANGIPARILENTLDCLASCFEKVNSMDQLEKFMSLYQSLFIIHISYPDDVQTTTTGSAELFPSTSVGSGEELKIAIINSFRKLINSNWNHYSSQNGSLFTLHTTSLFVSKILDVTTKEKNRHMVELALKTIFDLLQVTKSVILNKDPSEFSNIIESIFPGLISQVCKLIIQPPYISTRVQCAAYDLFSLVTFMNCADSVNIVTNNTDDESILHVSGSLTIESLSNAVFSMEEKNKVNGKFEKFEPFLKKVFGMEVYSLYGSSVSIDDVTEIQQCILDKCSTILMECNQTLVNCSSCLIECLLAGGRKIELTEFSNDSQDSFLQLLKSIPNICKTTTNERQKVSTYTLFHNYLDFILQTENGIEFICTELLMNDLTLSLMISLQMDRYNPITEENEYPKKTFHHFIDDRMIQVVYNICKLIGKKLFMKSTKYIDYLFNLSSFTSKSAEHSYKNEVILIVNCILEGMSESALHDKNLKIFINSLVDNISERLNENSSESVETNCLLLETISIICRFIEKNEEERDMFLLKILYPILNQLGYSSIHITQSCFKTISNISNYFYPNNNLTARENVMNLLVSNFDFMIDDIRYRLKYLSVYPHIPRVLNTLFEFNVMGKKFEEKSNASQYINTVTIVEDCIESVFNAIDQQAFEKSCSKAAFSTLFSVLGNIIKTMNILKLEREKIDISSKKDLSEKEIETVKSILQKLQHFMNSSQNTLITSVSFLSIIENAINMFQNSNIRDYDDGTTGNKVLPSVHILWPMLMTHLVQKRTAIPLKQRTIELLKIMAIKFDDFLFGRIMSDLNPYLLRVLKDYHTQFVIKYKKETTKLDYFRTESEFKFLKSILQFYSSILEKSDYFKEHVNHPELKPLSETITSLFLSEDTPEDFLIPSKNIVYLLSLEPLKRPEPPVIEDDDTLIEDDNEVEINEV